MVLSLKPWEQLELCPGGSGGCSMRDFPGNSSPSSQSRVVVAQGGAPSIPMGIQDSFPAPADPCPIPTQAPGPTLRQPQAGQGAPGHAQGEIPGVLQLPLAPHRR